MNAAPTALALDNSSIDENEVAGTTVGSFSSTDPNDLDSRTYVLVSGEGDTDNGSFDIVGDVLQSGASFDFESQDSYSIRVRITDVGGLFTEDTFTISVNPLNDNDLVLAAIGDQTVDEDAELTFTASATDADLPAETLTYSIDAASVSEGMSIDSSTGAFSWTPGEDQDGEYTTTVSVSDGTSTVDEVITITVNEVNVSPELPAIGDQTVDEQVELTFTASATDADLPAQTLTYSIDATSQEAGMSIDSSTGEFSWTPGEDQDGVHTTTITVSDGTATDNEEIAITVSDVLGLEDGGLITNIYPNPTSDIANLEMKNAYRGLIQIRVLDLSGKLIQTGRQMKVSQTFKMPITLANLQSGVHLVEIKIGDQLVVKRIIKD